MKKQKPNKRTKPFKYIQYAHLSPKVERSTHDSVPEPTYLDVPQIRVSHSTHLSIGAI